MREHGYFLNNGATHNSREVMQKTKKLLNHYLSIEISPGDNCNYNLKDI